MNLTDFDLKKLTEIAKLAAIKAGQYIRSQSLQRVAVNMKTGGDSLASQVVTEVDIQSQEIILKELTPTLKPYDLALLTEESEDDKSRFEKDYFWCIDPLDGTLSFIESTPGYAVSIALVSKNGEPCIGVVYDPVTDTLFYATKNLGAYKNGELLNFAKVQPFSQKILTFNTDRNFIGHPYFNIILKKLELVAKEIGCDNIKINKHSGAVMNACAVIDNLPSCYFKFPKTQKGGGSLWDYAASACIFIEAGAWVSDIYGNSLDLNRKNSTFLNHNGILFASDSIVSKHIINIYKNYLL